MVKILFNFHCFEASEKGYNVVDNLLRLAFYTEWFDFDPLFCLYTKLFSVVAQY